MENLLSERYTTHEYDVLIIGAGGAGLRAAIEAASVGDSVGVVCKSLLGEADILRRAMGKKKRAELEKQKQRFVEGAYKNGINKDGIRIVIECKRDEIGRRRVGKECRSRWSPYH